MSIGAALRRFSRTSGTLDMTREYITMFDDIVINTMPSGTSYAYAGYVNGLWPTFHDLQARYPKHRLLDMTVFASGNATGCDIENGDLTIDQAPAWFERQVARGVYRPVLYTSAGQLAALQRMMAACHIERSAYRLWAAHYTNRAHICGPQSCGFGLSEADGTQWTEKALGLNLDQSLLLPTFFDPRPAPKPPVPAPPKPVEPPKPTPEPVIPSWQETALNELPTLGQGDTDEPGKVAFVHRMQALIQVIGKVNNIEAGYDLKPDGSFGPKSVNALLAIQEHFGLKDTDEYTKRVCGPKTWPALVTGHA